MEFIPVDAELDPIANTLPESTTQSDHRREVEEIIRKLNGREGKTVAARAMRIDQAIDLQSTFESLCLAYSDAFVFAFSSSESGTWIGATPELLLRRDQDIAETMALAGTRKATENGAWDIKNIEEQQMVADFIKERMSAFCVSGSLEIGPTVTKPAGNVEHICTSIRGKLDNPESSLSPLLASLSPTPAVCGSDREASIVLISEFEKFDREYYAGFCGPNQLLGTTSFFVMLRSAKVTPNAICLYSGGGITHRSEAAEEWLETEMKSQTLIKHLKMK